jgi:type II secretion system protein J
MTPRSPIYHPPIRAAAFTLIELMIAVAIFGIVLAAINTVFFAAIRLREKTAAAADSGLPVERALDIMKRDLLGIVPTGALAGAVWSDTTVAGMSQPVALEFFTTTGILRDDQPWGDVQQIDYWLQPPTNGATAPGRDLIRGVTRNLLATTTPTPEPHPLLQGVQNLKFSYFDGTNWLDTWNPLTTLSNTPVAIKLRIEFAAQKRGLAAYPPAQITVPIVTQLVGTNQTPTIN